MRPGWVRVSARSSGAGEMPQGRCDGATCQTQPGPGHQCVSLCSPTGGCRAILPHRHPIPSCPLPAGCGCLELLKPRVPPAGGQDTWGYRWKGSKGCS